MANDTDNTLPPPSKNNQSSDSQTVTEPWEKSSSPLHISHSDQPGVAIVAQPLVEDNYTSWAQTVKMALKIKNKQGFIDGTLDKPTHNVDEHIQWERCDMLVKAWLLGAMTKEISKSVMHCSTASDMWMELKERFSHTNTVQLFETEKTILECRQGNSSVTTYFTRLKALWDKESICEFPACTCAASAEVKKYVETQKAMKFLIGLSDNFGSLRSTIISIDPLPLTKKIYAMALRHEKQVDISTTKQSVTVEASVFHTRKQENPPSTNRNSSAKEGAAIGQRCEICKYTNHTANNCRAHIKCTHCLGQGHSVKYCKWKRIGHPKSTRPPTPSVNNAAGLHVDTVGSHHVVAESTLPQDDRSNVIELLNKIKSGQLDLKGRKFLELINSTTTSSANLVGNASNYNDYAGFALEEDDWDGN